MPISQGVCNSFKAEVMEGVHALETDALYMALYTSAATLDATTTAYAITDETTGPGYTQGGQLITNVTVSVVGNAAIVDFDDVIWPNTTISAAGALIYNSSKANRAVAVIDFGGTKSSTADTFSVILPAATETDAIVRLV